MKLIYSSNLKTFFFKCKYIQKHIPSNAGFKWNKESGLWYTKDIFKARLLKKYADPELKERFKKYIEKYLKSVEDSYASYSDMEVPKPDNGKDFYNYQKAGIEFLNNRKYALLADDMGLGKTLITIGAINCIEDFNKILIICPNSVKFNWKKEWKEWSIHQDKDVRVYNSSNFENKGDVIIINYEVLNSNTNKNSKKFRDPAKGKYNSSLSFLNMVKDWKGIDVLVCDESHRLKNWSANTTKNTYKLRKYAEKMIFLTGTPMLSTPDDLWTTIKFFDLEDKFEKNKQNFIKKYCGAFFHRRFRRMVMDMDSVRPETLQELQLKLRKHMMLRRLKTQVLKELPDKVRSIIPVEIPQKYINQYQQIDESINDLSNLSTKSGDTSILKGIKPKQIEALTEFRQIVGKAKIKPVYDFVSEILDQGKKVVIFAHHTEVIESYLKKFEKYGAVGIYGKTPDNEREEAKEKFQTDPDTQVFIGNFRAASEGITLTAANTLVMAEFDWVPAIMKQAEDRIHRISQTESCDIYYMAADNTTDGYVLSKIIEKIKYIEQVMEKEKLSA